MVVAICADGGVVLASDGRTSNTDNGSRGIEDDEARKVVFVPDASRAVGATEFRVAVLFTGRATFKKVPVANIVEKMVAQQSDVQQATVRDFARKLAYVLEERGSERIGPASHHVTYVGRPVQFVVVGYSAHSQILEAVDYIIAEEFQTDDKQPFSPKGYLLRGTPQSNSASDPYSVAEQHLEDKLNTRNADRPIDAMLNLANETIRLACSKAPDEIGGRVQRAVLRPDRTVAWMDDWWL
ncbi:hypothetical protein ACFVKB_01870 [Rhodococcus sp. NPDC127530]|uniref:hypothetical protein n=1 Tax=unclassified Rhodococcus (in: high G+C Gram-positive bacteria) TaxID=192944 RepID=UPI00364316DA